MIRSDQDLHHCQELVDNEREHRRSSSRRRRGAATRREKRSPGTRTGTRCARRRWVIGYSDYDVFFRK